MPKRTFYRAACLALLLLTLASCQSSTPTTTAVPPLPTGAATATVDSVTAPAPTPESSATPAEPEERALVVCLADEPKTLYPYGGSSRSMWSVLEAVYDGPFDTRGYSLQPVILEQIPELDQGAVLTPVSVQAGDPVVDASGTLAALQAGMTVLPAGCASAECAARWDGQSPLQMDALTVTFKLKPGITWSDGAPLTAADSVYSFNLAADPATTVSKYRIDRTFSYEAPDAQTVVWTGVPGFFDRQFGSYFWLPLPKHAWGQKTAADLRADDSAARAPLGWGPYVIKEWTAGDHITLTKNPSYFRAGEGLPYFDTLVFRFTGLQGDNALAALRAGECDVVDQNPDFYAVFPELLDLETRGELKTYFGEGPEWEHLDFGIQTAKAGGVSLFGDARTRQAVALCIDRQKIVDELLYRRSSVPVSFVPNQSPLLAPDLPAYAFDPAAGRQLLQEAGWQEAGGGQPRAAKGVAGVPDGTPLAVTYLTTTASLRVQAAERVKDDLAGCGVQVEVKAVDPGELFAPGPDGPVFGRQFDLVQFAWEATSRPSCQLFETSQIPSETNQWIGANVTGYSDPAFDAACAASAYTQADGTEVQKKFTVDLPVVPLFAQVKFALSRPDLCGFAMDVTARSLFWNIEALNYGKACKPE